MPQHFLDDSARWRAGAAEMRADVDALFADLNELGRATARMTELPFLFCVISWGCAATEWLANVLNSHPHIFCVHAQNTFWHRLGGAPYLDGWQYLRILARTARSSKACGDVHGISRETIPDLRAKLGDRFNCAIVVREPLPRLRSQMALFEASPVKVWNVGYVQKFIDRGVLLPRDNLENRLFLHGVNMLNSVIQEEPLAPVWRSEDLTTSTETLASFIAYITRDHVEADLEWAKRAQQKPAANRHSAPNMPAHQFEPWQMDAISKIVERRAWEIYETLGYNTPDFVEPSRRG